MSDTFKLTRELLLQGGLSKRLRETNPDVKLLTDEERAASLAAILAQRQEHGSGLWVFGYGSLIWNPAIHITERRIARAVGWHRDFCLATKGGRGTRDLPGMMLGLKEGGECIGAVLRVAEEAIATELDLLWRREMVADGYIPRWVAVETPEGESLGHAIAFTINPAGPSYAPPMPEPELVARIATAAGELGTSAEYLFNTRDVLRTLGIRDPMLERVGAEVAAFQAHVDGASGPETKNSPSSGA